MKTLVTGATGLVGKSILARLERGGVLSHNAADARAALGDKFKVFGWSPEQGPPPAEAFSGVETIYHLAGEPVAAGRWTPERKKRIRSSRVEGTRQLVARLAKLKQRPKVLVAASAVGYYGDRGDAELSEQEPAAETFLAEVCASWEAESYKAAELGIRVVICRIGIVLAPNGGALKRMLPPFKVGLGGRLGDGKQYMPWIHVDDVAGLFLHASRTKSIRGAMNVTGPVPVTNKEFARTLGQVLHRPALLFVPRLGLKAAFGEMSELLLESQRALPTAALESGYEFRYRDLRAALQACL
ncbi:MAG: TIGR01777 family protein [Deltaproteobacteria bacterium CG2_30_63_29]|nr:MAG: TIGR01777 family protein [Deltaproteobacteria bacterium CG2_30_63_29]PJB37827.1 MAG: TIGR01777 family protein [Deltaproteobacteria bacterium CG_4_9_14_3_um_filter_63_12]